MRPAGARGCAVLLALALLPAAAPPARAQDYAPAAPAGPQPGAFALLERALPCGPGAPAAELCATRWLALASLETRAAALLVAPAGTRVALGVSQTGDPALGWTSVALAVGGAAEQGGAALRAVARLDRATGDWDAERLAREGGIEAGAGAWIAPGRATVLWASAPQLWLSGQSPPLLRPAELGARARGNAIAAWVVVVAPRRGDDGERSAGLSLGAPPLEAWGEVRDGPLRGSLGVRAVVRSVVVEASADAHPVLGETTRLGLAWRGAGRAH